MTIFNTVGGGGSAGLTFKDMVSGPYEVKASDWPDNIAQVRTYLFSHDDNLTSIEIKNGFTSIEDYAFSRATNLTDISVPDSITTVKANAFEYCLALKNIDIDHVTTLGTSAFYYCQRLENITLGNITKINSYVFYHTEKLEAITIPSTVTRIEGNSFTSAGINSASGLTITMLSNSPPVLNSSAFSYANINKIIVPQGTLTAYQTATNWATYASYMEEAA